MAEIPQGISLETIPIVEAKSDLQEPVVLNTFTEERIKKPKSQKFFFWATLATIATLLLIGFLGYVFIKSPTNSGSKKTSQSEVAGTGGFVPLDHLNLGQLGQVDVNGQLRVNGALVITPSSVPSNPLIGQIYFDEQNQKLYYYNGTEFLDIATGKNTVSSIQGLSGAFNLGQGFSLQGNTLSVQPSTPSNGGGSGGVSSLNGLSGGLTLANATGSGSTVTINDATTAVKGIASFNSSYFSVTAGAVSIATGAITSTELATDSVISSKILNGTITGADIASSTVANANLINNSITVTAGTGLTGGGAISLGSAATLNVAYGSTAGTAVQGSVSLVCPSGSGNLTGGGNTITLGSGGTCGGIGISNNPIFTTSVTSPQFILTGAGSNGTLQVASLAQPTAYTLPDPGGATATICLTTGNCAGAGGGVTTAGGTANTIAKFTGAQTLGNSTITDNGTTISLGSNTSISGSLTLTNQLSVANGGTGATTLTTNGVLYGNGASAIQATLAGTTGQCLVATTGSAPSWNSCAGIGSGVTLQAAYNNSINPEIVLDSTRGALTVRDNAVAIGANLFEVQNNTGATTYLSTSATGTTLSGNLAQSNGNFSISGNSASSLQTTSGTLSITSASASTWGTVTGNLTLQVGGSGATANIQIGAGGAGSETPDLLVLDNKNTIGDPAGTAGALYYNSNLGQFRCFGGSWTNCASTTLQGAYDSSISPATINTSDAKNLVINATDTATDSNVIVNLQATGDFKIQDNGVDALVFNDDGSLTANGTATGITRTTEAVARTNVTTVTTTVAGFADGDIIYINNAGQDYFTRITAGGGTTSLTVLPAVSYDASITIEKYNIQNIGALNTGTTFSNTNKFFQGYFLGGVVTGAGSTTYSDGRISTSLTTGLRLQNTADSTTAFSIQNTAGTSNLFVADTTNTRIGIGIASPISTLHTNGTLTLGAGSTAQTLGNIQIIPGPLTSPTAGRLTFGTDGTGWQFRIAKNQGGTVSDLLQVQDNGTIGITGAPTSATLTNFTQAIGNAGINIQSAGGAGGLYHPGIFWSSPGETRPKAGIWTFQDGSGSSLQFGTSNNYATGITQQGLVIGPSGTLHSDMNSAVYDVWLQGGAVGAAGSARNLALLGVASTDQLILNYNSEYACVSIGGGACTESLTVTGSGSFTGDIALGGKHAFRSSDTFLRLNQDNAFTSGIHTPYFFNSGSATVGAIYTSPGAGNINVEGDYYLDGLLGLSSASDGWLRLNNNGSFTNGVYTPGHIQASGYIQSLTQLNVSCGGGCSGAGGSGLTVSGTGGASSELGGAIAIVNSANGFARYLRLTTTGVWEWVNNAYSTVIFQYNDTGNAFKSSGAGSWLGVSDIRTKNIHSSFTDGLNVLNAINPVVYSYNGRGGTENNGNQHIGVIAQEIQRVAPYMVMEVADAEFGTKLTYDPTALDYILINSVKEQQAQIADLQAGNFDNINVAGDAVINNLTVTGSTTLQSLVVNQNARFNANVTVAGHIITAGNTPSAQVLSALFDPPSVSINGNDTAGTITITTRSTNVNPGQLFSMIFANSYTKKPKVFINPNNVQASKVDYYRDVTNSNVTFVTNSTLPANTTYEFDYFIVE